MITTWHVTYDGPRPLIDDLGVVAYYPGDYVNTIEGEGLAEGDVVELIQVGFKKWGIVCDRRHICAIRL